MKAATKKTRWLLLALLFGVLAAAGFTLAHHHGSRTVAEANDAAAPKHTVRLQTHATLLAASGGKHSFRTPAGVHPELLDTTYSDASQPPVNGHPNAPWHTANSTDWTYPAAHAVGGSSTTPAPSNRPATSGSQLPQDLADGVAYNYAPLDCELPAGCGATAAAGSLTRQPSGTSGGGSFAHNSQAGSSTNNSSTPDTTNDTGNTGNTGGTGKTGDTGSPGNTDNTGNTGNTGSTGSTGNKGNIGNTTKTSDPTDPSNPGSNQVAAAPELDPGTLAAAVTLLFGGLAILRSRRVRAIR